MTVYITAIIAVALLGGGIILGATATAIGYTVSRRHDLEHLVERAEHERQAGIRAGGELGWAAADRWYTRAQTLTGALRHERDKARRWRRLATGRSA